MLEYLDKEQNLRRNHTYFNQVNLYQGILEVDTALFVIYAKNDITVEKIDFDKQFFENQIENINEYYMNFYLPSVIGQAL